MPEKKWVVAAKRADFKKIAKIFSIDQVIARIIRNRGVFGENREESDEEAAEAIRKYLYGTLEDLYDPMRMKGIPEAVEVLREAAEKHTPVRIIGDYDIDGVMSSYILLRGFSRVGIDADVRIPERVRDGYGLNERLVREAAADGRKLIVTCDNGIAAAGEIATAYELGMRAIVTDHHEVPYDVDPMGNRRQRIPVCEAVIDPKQEGCAYPFRELCGAAVAFKLVQVLYQKSGVPEEESLELLEYVGFATVGDVMDLTDENRILVREGLKRLRHTDNPGLAALITQTGIDPAKLNSYHIGFVLGPCINAAGRLESAYPALKLLCAGGPEEASRYAGKLAELNADRQRMTEEGAGEAVDMVEKTSLANDRVLVVYLEDCHESLAGIIAGRLRERFHKPSFVITRTEEGAKGSGRSIETYHMYDELCKCRDCFTKFGGHAMAAGISLPVEKIGEFRRRINEVCTLTSDELAEKTVIDVPMPVSYLLRSQERLISQMELLEPFGKGNERPVFADSSLTVLYPKVVGKNRNVVRMQVTAGKRGERVDAVYFGDAEAFMEYIRQNPVISAIYYPKFNEFRGRRKLQITIMDYQ